LEAETPPNKNQRERWLGATKALILGEDFGTELFSKNSWAATMSGEGT